MVITVFVNKKKNVVGTHKKCLKELPLMSNAIYVSMEK